MYFIFINTNRPKNGGNDCGYKIRDKEASRTFDCEPEYCLVNAVGWVWDNQNSLKPNETMEEKIKETFPSWNLTKSFVDNVSRFIKAKDHYDISEELRNIRSDVIFKTKKYT